MKTNGTLWLVRDSDSTFLRPALDIEIAAIRATRFGARQIELRCGAVTCRLEER